MAAADATTERRERPAMLAAMLSALLALLKLGAWWLTGSAAMLAAALDSLSDVVVSAVNGFVIRAAGQPADEGHPYGHGKLEHLAGVFQALLIAVSGIVAGHQGCERFFSGEPLRHTLWGGAVALLSVIAALGLARYLRRKARELRSPALETDAAHYTADWMVNGGVLLALLAEFWLSSPWVDAVVAGIVALFILRTALKVFVDSAQALMDSGLSKAQIREIHEVLKRFEGRIHGYHDLLSRRSGKDCFVQLHVEMDADLVLRDAHELVEEIRAALEGALPCARVIIHLDPWPENTERDPHDPLAPAAKL